MSTEPVAAWVAALPRQDTIADPYPPYARLRPETPVYGYRDYPPGTVPDHDEAITAWVLMKYADADKVVVTGHLNLNALPTGREIDSDFVHVITLGGGRWTRFRDFMNTAVAAAAFAG